MEILVEKRLVALLVVNSNIKTVKVWKYLGVFRLRIFYLSNNY